MRNSIIGSWCYEDWEVHTILRYYFPRPPWSVSVLHFESHSSSQVSNPILLPMPFTVFAGLSSGSQAFLWLSVTFVPISSILLLNKSWHLFSHLLNNQSPFPFDEDLPFVHFPHVAPHFEYKIYFIWSHYSINHTEGTSLVQ